MQNGSFPTCNITCDQCDMINLGVDYCLSCPTNSFRTLNNGKCLCNDGYYDIGLKVCNGIIILKLACHASCKTCKDYQLCIDCPINSFRTLDNNTSKCVCQPGYLSADTAIC